jgi:hypothetical protein
VRQISEVPAILLASAFRNFKTTQEFNSLLVWGIRNSLGALLQRDANFGFATLRRVAELRHFAHRLAVEGRSFKLIIASGRPTAN